MAESVIALGIGASPVSLTPFITTGLLIGDPTVFYPTDGNVIFIPKLDRFTRVKRADRLTAVRKMDRWTSVED